MVMKSSLQIPIHPTPLKYLDLRSYVHVLQHSVTLKFMFWGVSEENQELDSCSLNGKPIGFQHILWLFSKIKAAQSVPTSAVFQELD